MAGLQPSDRARLREKAEQLNRRSAHALPGVTPQNVESLAHELPCISQITRKSSRAKTTNCSKMKVMQLGSEERYSSVSSDAAVENGLCRLHPSHNLS